MSDRKSTQTEEIESFAPEIRELWEEIDCTDWRNQPFYGMISKVSKELGITRQAGYNAIRRRNIQFGIKLLSEKRLMEKRVRNVLR